MDRERIGWGEPWPLFATFYYRDPLPRLIVSLKFAGRTDLAEALAPFLYRTVKRCHIDVDALIPVPLHRKRFVERGYNQAALLAEMLGAESGLPVVDRLLYRKVHTSRQSESRTAEERRRHLADAFQVDPRAPAMNHLRGRHVLLIDDVLTTGATLAAAAKALAGAGIGVICLAAASDKEKYLGYEEVLADWT